MLKHCVINELKLCDNCGECNCCDLDPNKLCDNCCKCLSKDGTDADYRSVSINFLDDLEQDHDSDLSCFYDDDDALGEGDALDVLQIDKELLEKWEDILSKDAKRHKNNNEDADASMPHAIRRRRGR